MSAYNKVNGVYPAEHHWLGQRVLRGEWGFNGVYLTDWGAMDGSYHPLGLDWPVNARQRRLYHQEDYRGGERRELSESELDEVVAYLLYVINNSMNSAVRQLGRAQSRPGAVSQLGPENASESMVLLKNEEGSCL